MFKKKIDTNFKDFYEKIYEYEGSIYDAMDKIVYSEIPFSSVKAKDIGDVGMKYFGGEYSYETFINMYERIKFDIDSLSLYFGENDSIHISPENKNIILLSKNLTVDLNNILEKKNKQL